MTDPNTPPPDGKSAACDPAGSGRGAVVALLLLVVLAAGGFWLSQHLRAANRLQDFVLAGRANCAPMQ